ncbi:MULTISPECIES: TadE family type IV pilus minor pilin [unclassified Streptomyces]|uniref:TadE family type IV pilus minor pilin n=1 Tax=unclassified Streptomyces TaxID=2593676 RepID=UPI002E29E647|nr:TadE family type IV pilus minor pilin [Streptomyces sp. NBC_01423]WSX91789.1 pilus assembly protein [Streptomyces sp. NBC_00891]WSY06266.1 pilus assembly protein [Streptomyces sp. NBC_00890]WSZ07891.1 pilus assembly protein [Streptomyces sp. NBC_00869]WSZ24610.1 pilus assembly protein [Streptomyces sp. NBC_00870]
MRSSEGGAEGFGLGAVRRFGREVCGGQAAGVERRRDRGAVTAEAAMVIPVLAVFALALLWALMAASAQIRCVDAARAGARAAARSEPAEQVREAALSAAPDGASVVVERAGTLWRVNVTAPTPGPGPLTVTLRAEAAAAAEDAPVPTAATGPDAPDATAGEGER